jgi:hypothetical protein
MVARKHPQSAFGLLGAVGWLIQHICPVRLDITDSSTQRIGVDHINNVDKFAFQAGQRFGCAWNRC